MMCSSNPGRILAVLLGTIVGLVLLSGPAWAHVEIVPDSAEGGSSGTFTFHVPNERDNASTVRVEVVFPRTPRISSVQAETTVAGWLPRVITSPVQGGGRSGEQAISSIVWEGGSISPGSTGEFRVVLGPLPTDGQLVFKALQTYSDGEVVRWIDQPAGEDRSADPGAEPEHPAAVLTLMPAGAGHFLVSRDAGSGLALPGVIGFTGLIGLTLLVLHRRISRRSTRPFAGPDRTPTDSSRR